MSEPRQEHVVADSLLQYLYKQAVLRIRVAGLTYRAEFRERNTMNSAGEAQRREHRVRFKSVAERQGFRQVPHVDGDQLFYDREDAVLMLYTEKVARDGIYVYSEDRREFAKLCEILSDNLEVDRWS